MIRHKSKKLLWIWTFPLLLIIAVLIWRIFPAPASCLARALSDRQVTLIPTEADLSQGKVLALINADNPCPDISAGCLVNLYAQKDRGFSLASSEIELTEDTFEAAKAMFLAAAADGAEGFILSSGYRSYQAQAEEYAKAPSIAAKPGFSEHGSGLAFDVTAYGPSDFSKTPQFAWLYANCWDHGFILRYPSDKVNITGIPSESWHYRYVGLPHSRIMGEMGLCLEEYAQYLEKYGPFRAEYQGQSWIVGLHGDGNIRCITVE